MRKNQQIADALHEIADLLELEDIQFKPRAYHRAAEAIEGLADDIEDLAKQDKLEEIPGVGKSIAEKIIEFLKTGRIKHLEELRRKTPVKVKELEEIEGVGPKTVKKLYNALKVKTLQDLENAAKTGKIRSLKGFTEATDQRILEGIKFHEGHKGRMLLGVALPLAEEIIAQLKRCKDIEQISLGGSLNRKAETIGDIDILVAAKRSKPVMDFFTSMDDLRKVLAKGETKSSIQLKSGTQVDLRVVDPKSWGAALQYFTGSKMHNIKVRQLAIKKGYKLNEYGLFKNENAIAARTEEEVYAKLGMQTPSPEMREDKGEVELALNHKLPILVNEKDIKGDFHVHSTWSDGSASILQMAQAAKQQGRSYFVQTDHTGKLKIAGGMEPKAIERYIKEIDAINKKLNGFRILKGVEVNIEEDGSPDIKDTILKKLDIVVGSVHWGFKGTREALTKRLMKALEHPHIHILGHPTGRLLQEREGYELDFERVFDTARERGKVLEINAQPARLDLNDDHVREAVKRGVKLAISTDAHHPDHFRYMRYGVYVARRGWCEKKDIINCMPVEKVLKLFH